ncbi:hypothetical protein BJY24_007020 [Nocardia transvalensis]|uniref:Uncharacterized protein n=1 Tax=Nocardia transvalensis TaxID=37333 RepID=A0A7W9UM12_9NOCA|nr:hypothetical protein [Nocardia transvalensis]MBB5918108.1 hypothetical protein [Nocardia transvalensis]
MTGPIADSPLDQQAYPATTGLAAAVKTPKICVANHAPCTVPRGEFPARNIAAPDRGRAVRV